MKRIIVVGAVALAGIWTAAVPAQAGSSAAYVVAVKQGADPAAVAAANAVSPTMVFDAVGGFAANLTSKQVNRLRSNAAVESVELDAVVATIEPGKATPIPPPPPQFVTSGVRRIGGLSSPTAKIDGIDERVDIDVAVIDDGVDAAHPDLNVAGVVNCVNPSHQTVDPGDHGTLVAGFVGAIDNGFGAVGVAPGARIWGVQASTPAGILTLSRVLCGFEWVAAHADVIDVVNMSFGFHPTETGDCVRPEQPGNRVGQRDLMHEGLCVLHRAGVTLVAAAGNDASDLFQTPAGFDDEVISVSAIGDNDGQPGGLGSPWVTCFNIFEGEQPDDHFAFFSNFGPHTDIAAPGVCISSTYPGGLYATNSGTSFATPLVAGAAALYISTHPDATPAEVQAALVAAGEPGPIPGDPDGYPEPVLNVRGL